MLPSKRIITIPQPSLAAVAIERELFNRYLRGLELKDLRRIQLHRTHANKLCPGYYPEWQMKAIDDETVERFSTLPPIQ
ncbi:MAG TPA: hypothetical protein VGO47_14695 [Chlamydiales bacterium]|jgi:hypothetical protein|nr:hypothetical protein [Chlamydiales bacterium]